MILECRLKFIESESCVYINGEKEHLFNLFTRVYNTRQNKYIQYYCLITRNSSGRENATISKKAHKTWRLRFEHRSYYFIIIFLQLQCYCMCRSKEECNANLVLGSQTRQKRKIKTKLAIRGQCKYLLEKNQHGSVICNKTSELLF